MAKVTDVVANLARPIVEQAGCTLWDVEYVKEAGEWFLRVYIDREGGVTLAAAGRCPGPCPTCWTGPTPSRGATPSRCPPPGWTRR